MHQITRIALILMALGLLAACDEEKQATTPANNAAPNNANNQGNNANNANNQGNNQNNNNANNQGNNANNANNQGNNQNNNTGAGPGVQIGAQQARSCEVTLRDAAQGITEVTYGQGVEGRWMRRGDLVLLAFTRTADQALDADAVQFSLQEQAPDAELVSARCFDAQGATLDQPAVALIR